MANTRAPLGLWQKGDTQRFFRPFGPNKEKNL